MRAGLAAFVLVLTAALPLRAADLARFVEGIEPGLLVPGSDRLGPPDGDPPAAPAYGAGGQLGWVILNTDFADATGFTGRPVRLLVGLDRDGAIVGAMLVEHREGNLRTGVPEADILAFLAGLVERGGDGGVDALSGATISAEVMRGSVRRAAGKFARLRGLRGGDSGAERRNLADLAGAGLLTHRVIAGGQAGATTPFLELWAAAVGPDDEGFLLLDAYDREALAAAMAPGERAVLAGAGGWAISADPDYVAGSFIDGIRMIEGERRLAPRAIRRDIGMRLLPAGEAAVLIFAEGAVDSRLQVEMRQVVSLTSSRMLRFDLPLAAPAVPPLNPVLTKLIPAAALVLAVVAVFAWRRHLARRRWIGRIRLGLLLASVLIVGLWLKAPLSATAVLAAATAGPQAALRLWSAGPAQALLLLAVIAALPLIGRGLYCGWLCPFGAAQELLGRLGRLWRPLRHIAALAAPIQRRRRWPLAVLAGLAVAWLAAPDIAPALGEIEPFNAAFVLSLVRPWPYLVYPLLLLLLALVLPRPFCRWLCPFGALLALLGRDPRRLLHRPGKCPSWCRRCARVCPAGAIAGDNGINPAVCVLCLRCSEAAAAARCPRPLPQTDGGYS